MHMSVASHRWKVHAYTICTALSVGKTFRLRQVSHTHAHWLLAWYVRVCVRWGRSNTSPIVCCAIAITALPQHENSFIPALAASANGNDGGAARVFQTTTTVRRHHIEFECVRCSYMLYVSQCNLAFPQFACIPRWLYVYYGIHNYPTYKHKIIVPKAAFCASTLPRCLILDCSQMTAAAAIDINNDDSSSCITTSPAGGWSC